MIVKLLVKMFKKLNLAGPSVCPCRNLEKGLYEARSNISNGRIARILFCIQKNEMILLHAIIKKTQSTPDREKELARKRMKGKDDND
jgi:phage-related protein